MREAIFADAREVDKEVGSLISKIQICERMGWTFKEYGEHKASDLRKIKNYYKWKAIKAESKKELGSG